MPTLRNFTKGDKKLEILENYFHIIIIGVCLCVGYIVKNIIPNEKINRFIPLIAGIIGIVMSLWINGFAFSPEIILTGLVSGLASTGMHQIFKQFIEKGE